MATQHVLLNIGAYLTCEFDRSNDYPTIYRCWNILIIKNARNTWNTWSSTREQAARILRHECEAWVPCNSHTAVTEELLYSVRYTLTSTLYNVPSTRSAVTAQPWCVTNLPRSLLTLSSHRRYLANHHNGCFPSHLRAWNYKTKAYKEENQGCCWVTSSELSICLESKSDRGRSPKHKFIQSSSSIDERYDSQTRRYQ
jgi:hypothetical protein